MFEYIYAISWFIIIEIIGLITFPILSFACTSLHDKGYSFSKIQGILLLTFIVWIFGSYHVVKFGLFNILLSLLILVLVTVLLIYRKKIDLIRLLKQNKQNILKNELIFAAAFFVFIFIQMNNPNIFYAYSEDFMDYGFIKSILCCAYFPPADPWYVGDI